MESDEQIVPFLIKTKCGNFKSFKEVQTFAEKQYDVLQNTLLVVKKQEDEIKHLKALLDATADLDCPVVSIIKSPAEIVCERQIEKLYEIAMQRMLSIDETKQLDLLIKNLRLVQGKSTTINSEKIIPKKELPTDSLLKLANFEIKKEELSEEEKDLKGK